MMKVKLLLILSIGFLSAGIFAQSPESLNYQAVARTGGGEILQDQSVTVVMGIYSGSGGNTLVYEETHNVSTNEHGLFTLKIGNGTTSEGNFSDIAWGEDTHYLQVQLDIGEGMVNLGKTQFVSVPYALHAKTVANTLWETEGSNAFYDAGNVGIGTDNPAYPLHLHTSSGPSQMRISDDASGLNSGMRIGLNGSGTASVMNDYAGGGLAFGTAGTTKMVLNDDGQLSLGSSIPMVKLHVKSEGGEGTLGSELGVQYSANQMLEPAIYGHAEGNTGDISYGVLGNSYSNNISFNMGVFGEGGGGTQNNYGIYGVDYGESGSSYSIAVYGDNQGNAGTNYAGYFDGDVTVTGTLSKGGGSFKIDHPDDPANKYLSHSFVESPDMMNVYNGNVTTDADGVAEVTLPDYFKSLNRDFRYQLTVIGTFAQAIVSEEIDGNHFTIKTDKPNVKVSWQVTGVRKDKWAEENRIVPVQEKEGVEKGKYLHPEVHSRSEEDKLPTGIK
ncbi:MAG: hypothetical protein U5L09_21110 [Bacteroidales bacterium]|nr:hypothetical protein [Bacteroidales bacterium]